MDIKVYAAILLIVRIASMILMGAVLKRQLQLFKMPIDKEIKHYRIILFLLALAIFAGNIIPATIDFLTTVDGLTRSAKTINGVGLVYSMAWAVTSLLSAVLIWWLYRMSHNVDESHKDSDHTLTNDESIRKAVKK